MKYNGVEIDFDPNAEDDTLAVAPETTTSRRKERVDLAWKDLSFSVQVAAKKQKPSKSKSKSESESDPSDPSAPDDAVAKKGRTADKVILRSMSGAVRAGSMLAVMGSSGAGKTSLLNLLAGRITSKNATASGAVYVNGKPREYATFKKLAAYVLQDDDMFAELTVQEQLTYAALLRLPACMPKDKKLLRVQRVIQELGLAKVQDTMIGDQIVRGISGGERKRVNIGTELVTDPALLFLDEPTTGLDSFNALNVMTSLRQLASNGRTVISTIHQPRSSIFGLFDQLCLLSEGRVMYFGPARDAVPYFASLSFQSPAQFNPADFFLDLLSVDPRSPERETCTKARVQYLGDRFVEKGDDIPLLEAAPQDAEAAGRGHGDAPAADEEQLRDTEFQTSWVNEFVVLYGRSLKLASRERTANGVRLGQVFFFSIILGLIWLNNGRIDDDGGEARKSLSGVMFFIIINQAFGGVFAVIFGFPLERSIITRERASSTYRTSSYFLSKTMTDFPKTLFFNALFSVIVYWMVGLEPTAGAFFIYLLVIFLTSFISESLAIAVSVMTGDAQSAAGIIPVFIILAVLFGGFFIGASELDGWIAWAKWLSFVFYAFNALGKNEFQNRVFDNAEIQAANDQALANFNDLSVWENVAALCGLMVVFRLTGYLFLHYLRGPKFLKF